MCSPLKGILKAQQSLFSKPVAKGKARTEASFCISRLLVKRKKPFTDGEVIKEAMTGAADVSLLKGFKNKDEMTTAINQGHAAWRFNSSQKGGIAVQGRVSANTPRETYQTVNVSRCSLMDR